MDKAIYLSEIINQTTFFDIVSEGKLPVVVFRFKNRSLFNEESYTKLLRTRKWMLPYYQLSGNSNLTVMRIVVRSDMTKSFIKKLTTDLVWAYKFLNK